VLQPLHFNPFTLNYLIIIFLLTMKS